jgi:cell wall-associated NlpC family hydrolase
MTGAPRKTATPRPKSGPRRATAGKVATKRRPEKTGRPGALFRPTGTEAEQRARVVAEAISWIRTPYHHEAAIKGEGVDCALFLREAFVNAGLIETFDPGYYPPDWHLHKDEERYLQTVERFAKRRLRDDEIPQPGDIVVWRIGHCFAHGAIVTSWPLAIHAYAQSRTVSYVDVETETRLLYLNDGSPRPRRFYSLWGE